MSYAIFRCQSINTLNDLSHIGSYNKREKESYKSNPDIRKEGSINNIELVKCNNKYREKFYEITKENLINYNNNQELLELKRKNLKIELEEINIELKKIEKEITEKNTLFSLESVLDNLENQIADMNIDISSVDKIINQLNNKRKKINQKIKDELSFNNQLLIEFYEIINKYAIELGIKQYIKNDNPSFVLTNKLKGSSGRVLAQMAYVFKLAYLKSIDNKYGIKLPIIIDSPRTNELSESSTDDMLKILKRDFSEHQIIIASIYDINILNSYIIDLNNGLMKN